MLEIREFGQNSRNSRKFLPAKISSLKVVDMVTTFLMFSIKFSARIFSLETLNMLYLLMILCVYQVMISILTFFQELFQTMSGKKSPNKKVRTQILLINYQQSMEQLYSEMFSIQHKTFLVFR